MRGSRARRRAAAGGPRRWRRRRSGSGAGRAGRRGRTRRRSRRRRGSGRVRRRRRGPRRREGAAGRRAPSTGGRAGWGGRAGTTQRPPPPFVPKASWGRSEQVQRCSWIDGRRIRPRCPPSATKKSLTCALPRGHLSEKRGSGPRDPVEHPQRLLVGGRQRLDPDADRLARGRPDLQQLAAARDLRGAGPRAAGAGPRRRARGRRRRRRPASPSGARRRRSDGHRGADRGGPGGPGERVDVPGRDVDEHQVVPERRRRSGRAGWAAPRRGRSPRAGAPGTGGWAAPTRGPARRRRRRRRPGRRPSPRTGRAATAIGGSAGTEGPVQAAPGRPASRRSRRRRSPGRGPAPRRRRRGRPR